MSRHEGAADREFGVPHWFAVVFAGLSGLLFAGFVEELGENDLAYLDREVGELAKVAAHRGWLQAMIWITELGSVWWITLCVLVSAGILWYYRRQIDMFWLLFVVGSSGLLTKLVKQTFRRARPSIDPSIDAVGYSFPSGHAVAVMAFYGFIIYLLLGSRSISARFKTWTAALLTALILLVGVSRVILKAHFPSDVIAGYLLGLFCLSLAILGTEAQKRKRLRNEVKQIEAFDEDPDSGVSRNGDLVGLPGPRSGKNVLLLKRQEDR
jgi:membrane-associated phospholipid phosphatase